MMIPPYVLSAACHIEANGYVYDLNILRDRLRQIEDALPIRRRRIHFATMANDHPSVLATIAETGHGVFVNSPAHLHLALGAGLSARRIIYAASNMSGHEMRMCLDAGVHLVMDSATQLAGLDAIAPAGTSVGIRVNVGSAIETPSLAIETSYRFGLLADEVGAAVSATRNVRVTGAHCYFGTDILDPDTLLDGLERLSSVAVKLPHLEYVDGGGGFGIADDFVSRQFDLAAYGAGAAAIMAWLEQRTGRPVTLIVEPGRWLCAPIGWFFARVTDVKPRADRILAGVAASVVQFPRMLLHPDKARHPCEIVDSQQRPPAALPVWVTGNSTYSRDFLARGAALPHPKVGDLIAFHNAGAYCRSMCTRFLGKEDPEEILLHAPEERRPLMDAFVTAAQ
ncbi:MULTISPECIES: diaminopimelate decarboxylase family protein [Bradyrhizobium]|uniref:diaminopimelate decarboxylase family protein n=1 Tax=Bradyrhizobium pachyrhizi TaxID=280333 RepID=UPI0004227D89